MAEPGVDPTGESDDRPFVRMTVDDEVFDVRSDRPGAYDYDWISGPNDGYGFSVSSSEQRPWTHADHESAVRDFLAMINPETGYIE